MAAQAEPAIEAAAHAGTQDPCCCPTTYQRAGRVRAVVASGADHHATAEAERVRVAVGSGAARHFCSTRETTALLRRSYELRAREAYRVRAAVADDSAKRWPLELRR